MTDTIYIPLEKLCEHYQTEVHFITELHEVGLIEIVTIEELRCIHQEDLRHLEKLIRIQKDLNVPAESLDIVNNLLGRIEDLQEELKTVRSRLRLYE